MADWSELQTDLLHCIFEKLSVPDILRSTAVCSSWSAAVRDLRRRRRHELRQQSPWLMLSGGHDDPSAAKFFSLSERRFYTIPLPGPPIRSRFCIGSSHGWLITADRRSELQLLNPITGAQIDLPTMNTLPYTGLYNCRLTVERRYQYVKAALSSNPSTGDYTVMLICTSHETLSFARAGDKKWATLPTRYHCYGDVIFHRGRFYTVTSKGTVEIWDLSRPAPSSTIMMLQPEDNNFMHFYLIQAPWGDLFQVCWDMTKTDEYGGEQTKVFKMDLEGGRLLQVDNLGKHALFLGINHSLCLSSSHLPELRSNHIYFANGALPYGFWGFGIYNLEDGSVSPVLPSAGDDDDDDDENLFFPHPIWVTPSLM